MISETPCINIHSLIPSVSEDIMLVSQWNAYFQKLYNQIKDFRDSNFKGDFLPFVRHWFSDQIVCENGFILNTSLSKIRNRYKKKQKNKSQMLGLFPKKKKKLQK